MTFRALVQIVNGAEAVYLERRFNAIPFAPFPGLTLLFRNVDGEEADLLVKDVCYDTEQGEFIVSPESEFCRDQEELEDHIGAWEHDGFRRA